MNRNVNDYFSKTPTPHFPRSRFDMGVHKRLQTQAHGRLTPFFARIVYPGDTWQMDMSTFVRMDTSFRVPLDDVYLDTYFFFVPFRIIDKNFEKVLGAVEPYDETEYNFPSLQIVSEETIGNLSNLLPYLGYSQCEANTGTQGFTFDFDHAINPYPLSAYYKIYNDWFRDENLDPTIPYEDLYDISLNSNFYTDMGTIFDNLDCLKVNKYHDYFTSAMISPQKGPAVTIPLGTAAPVVTGGSHDINKGVPIVYSDGTSGTLISGQFLLGTDATGREVVVDKDLQNSDNQFRTRAYSVPNNLYADLGQAAGTINQLRLAFAIQALYERRGRYGTRYIETIRGQWGIEVPDSFFERPEYLGGSRVTLNNVPVLSTENSSQLGQMAGNSATLSGGNSFSKTFIEYGVIIGLSVTRIKHSYTQGFNKELFGLKTALDLYNPVFANIGFEPIKTNEIYNQGDYDNSVFAYQEAWAYLRTQTDSFAGQFGIFSTNIELKNKWHYGDYYSLKPSFSASWLKEDYKNVARTLTGQLIAGAGSTETEGHQFMFGYYFHPIVTRILPSHSVPVELIGRL